VTLNKKNTLTYYLHELFTEYGEKKDPNGNNQMAFLTCLVDLCKIVYASIQSVIEQDKIRAAKKEPDAPDPVDLVKFELGEKELL